MLATILSASRPFHPGTPWGLFRFESPESGGPAGDPVDTADPVSDPGLEAGADDPVQPSAAAPEPAAPAWGPGTPEFDFELEQAIDARLGQYQEPQQQDDYQGGPELDPFSDEFGQQLVGTFGQMLEQALETRLGPIQQTHEAQQIAEGKQQSLDTFSQFSDLGDFDHEEAFTRAQEAFTGYLNQYGPRYADQFTHRALREAAERQASLERKFEERGAERYKQQMATAAGRGGGEPGVAGGGVRPEPEASSYDEVIARWDARRAAGAHQS